MRLLAARVMAAGFLLGASASDAIAQVNATDSTSIVTITRSLGDAITNGDSAVWAPNLSARWFIIDEEGNRVTRSDFLRDLHPLPPGQHGVIRLADWHLVGTPAVIVMSYTSDEQHDYYGQQLHTRFHLTDTWIREGDVWRILASQITALPTPVPGRRLPLSVLQSYVGTYALTPEITLDVMLDGTALNIRRPSRSPAPLRALDERIFVRDSVRGFWLFETDSAGSVTRLVHWRDNNPVVWTRRR